MIVGRNEIAEILGVSPRHINNLVDEGLPHSSDGKRVKYDVALCVAWWVARKVEEVKAKAEPVNEWDAKARVDTLRADILELELGEKRRELMPVALHRKELVGAFQRVDARLMTFADKVARVVIGTRDWADGRTRVLPVVEELRGELYQADDVPLEDAPAGAAEDAARAA
jgi:phage terminase Nu1 subunit (DNA packaging protein)